MSKMKSFGIAFGFLLFNFIAFAQSTFPENGIADPRTGHYAFTNATIVKDGNTTMNNATLVIRKGKITQVGTGLKVPAGAVTIDCKGKYIYPSFIDIYADYGTGTPQRPAGAGGFNPGQQAQLITTTKGAYGWNAAIKSDADAFEVFTVDDAKAKPLREAGFVLFRCRIYSFLSKGI
jgi:hypothetical protein